MSGRFRRYPGPPVAVEPAIDALIAAGAVDPDGAVVREVRSVARVLGTARRPPKDLADRWRSVLARHGRSNVLFFDERPDVVLVGATTPAVDGSFLRVDELLRSGDRFGIRVSASPMVGVLDTSPVRFARHRIAWWAEDDLGNPYAGFTHRGWAVDDHALEGATVRAVVRAPVTAG